jgi:hypothetical protein
MKKQIRITAGSVSALAELNTTRTAEAIWQALPLKAKTSTWGDEIYFAIPVKVELENGQEVVNLGDLGYWPEGNAFCIFFGPTPVSKGSQIRPASAVNIFGKLMGDPKVFQKVKRGEPVIVDRV